MLDVFVFIILCLSSRAGQITWLHMLTDPNTCFSHRPALPRPPDPFVSTEWAKLGTTMATDWIFFCFYFVPEFVGSNTVLHFKSLQIVWRWIKKNPINHIAFSYNWKKGFLGIHVEVGSSLQPALTVIYSLHLESALISVLVSCNPEVNSRVIEHNARKSYTFRRLCAK